MRWLFSVFLGTYYIYILELLLFPKSLERSEQSTSKIIEEANFNDSKISGHSVFVISKVTLNFIQVLVPYTDSLTLLKECFLLKYKWVLETGCYKLL